MKNVETFKVKPVVAARRKKTTTISPREILEEFLEEMKASTQWGKRWTRVLPSDNDDELIIRGWGDWIIDPEDMDGDEYVEEYDFKILSYESQDVLENITTKIEKKYSVSIVTEECEKEILTIYIK